MAEKTIKVCDGCGKEEKFSQVPEIKASGVVDSSGRAIGYTSSFVARSNLCKWREFDFCDRCAHVADMVEEYIASEVLTVEAVQNAVSDALKRAVQ